MLVDDGVVDWKVVLNAEAGTALPLTVSNRSTVRTTTAAHNTGSDTGKPLSATVSRQLEENAQ